MLTEKEYNKLKKQNQTQPQITWFDRYWFGIVTLLVVILALLPRWTEG